MSEKIKAVVVDYDDTIGNFLGYLCHIHNKLFHTCVTEFDITEWDFENLEFQDVRGNAVKGAELKETMRRYEPHGLYSSMPLLADAKFALDTLKKIGYNIIILTARPEIYREQTILNVLANDLSYDHIIFDWDKAKVINELSEEYDIHLFVDDNPDTVKVVQKECDDVKRVCLINKSHNKKTKLSRKIKRVGSLFDCIKYLDGVNNK